MKWVKSTQIYWTHLESVYISLIQREDIDLNIESGQSLHCTALHYTAQN